MSVAHEDQIRTREMDQITPTESKGNGPNGMEVSNSESSLGARHLTQPANLASPELVNNESSMDIPVRRSQRANFGVPPIRWGHVES